MTFFIMYPFNYLLIYCKKIYWVSQKCVFGKTHTNIDSHEHTSLPQTWIIWSNISLHVECPVPGPEEPLPLNLVFTILLPLT